MLLRFVMNLQKKNNAETRPHFAPPHTCAYDGLCEGEVCVLNGRGRRSVGVNRIIHCLLSGGACVCVCGKWTHAACASCKFRSAACAFALSLSPNQERGHNGGIKWQSRGTHALHCVCITLTLFFSRSSRGKFSLKIVAKITKTEGD